jgi:Fic family protein
MNENILKELRHALLERVSIDSLPIPVLERQSITNTWGTNSIEGNTLSLAEVEKVITSGLGVRNRPLGDIIETRNHYMAFMSLVSLIPKRFDLVMVQELHEKVFKGVMPDAGQWRRSNVWIRSASFTPVRWEKVVPQLTEWQKEYAKRETAGGDLFESAAWMHHRFESIHPFTDGNGRVGRLLLNVHFLKRNWPPVSIAPFNRSGYLDALEKGNDGDLADLTEFLRIAMSQSLIDLLDQVGSTKDDELLTTTELGKKPPYSAKYLALRAKQGSLPALKRTRDWMTSRRALDLYLKYVGRN